MVIKTKKSRKRSFAWLLLIVILLVAATTYYWYFIRQNSTQDDTTISKGSSKDIQNKVNTSPPTSEEKQVGDAVKEGASNQTPASEKDASGLYMVSPSIIGAGISGDNYYARGYVGGITEGGGTCTYIFTSNSTSESKPSTSRADATTTVCPQVTLPKSSLPAGQVQVVLQYKSSTSVGTSPTRTIQ